MMPMRPPIALVVLLCLTMLVSCRADPTPSLEPSGRATFTTYSGPVRTSRLEVADTEAERELGLMGRTDLTPESGMVFVYDDETARSFWMKDTLIPLSIAFWGEDGRVVDILEMEPCRADPCTVYTPRASYTTALEMNAGWFDEHGVKVGDRVELQLATE
jgi:uncharacterized protein